MPTLFEDASTIIKGVNGKRCSRCKWLKLYKEFARAKHSSDGYFAYCKECNNSRNRKAYKKSPKEPEVQKRNALKRMYDLTPGEYEARVVAQSGRCAACGSLETKIDHRSGRVRGLSVDHDHRTGKVRALLCGSCNVALGHLGDDPERIQNLQDYILRYS